MKHHIGGEDDDDHHNCINHYDSDDCDYGGKADFCQQGAAIRRAGEWLVEGPKTPSAN